MTVTAFRQFPDAGIVALFDEASGGGDVLDIDALRNRPAADPEAWLQNIRYHSDLQLLEVVSDAEVEIAHGDVDPSTLAVEGGQVISGYDVGDDITDWVLVDHSLGYAPHVLVALDNGIVSPGYPAQVPGVTNGSVRYVTPWVDDTYVYLREVRARGGSTLSGTTLTYRVIVFREPRVPTGNKLFDFDPGEGVATMARETFDLSRRYLQVVAGGSPFSIATGRTMDCANGAPRLILADGTAYDPVPDDTQTGVAAEGYLPFFGDHMDYTGSFAGGDVVHVQAP